MSAALLARLEGHARPLLTRLPPAVALRLYAAGRRRFAAAFAAAAPRPWAPPADLARTLWGIDFRAPLGNAAGLFKSGDGYGAVSAQGAGFYLAGTTTATPRVGNRRGGVFQPFAPYPRSGAASNWLGLPNPGHAATAAKLAGLARTPGCPVGVSLSADPGEGDEEEKLDALVLGLRAYAEAGVDFLEINESCPNTEDGPADLGGLEERLRHLHNTFLAGRERPLPVLVKLSCDTAPEQAAPLVEMLAALGFDGVNFGNTSTDYDVLRQALIPVERRLFDAFTKRYGGGVSGRPLKGRSLELVRRAASAAKGVAREFHIVRTGGVESVADLYASLEAGASLAQWYTGYFEAFSRVGHKVYREILGA